MVTEILTLKGESDGINTSGDFPLYSDIIYHDAMFPLQTKIIIPFGMKVKIWAKRFAAEGETLFQIFFSNDATVASPSWNLVDAEKLASKGEISLEKRRPIVLRSITGKEGFKVSWLQPTAVKAFVDLEVEFTDE
jgi:hypothetical protein